MRNNDSQPPFEPACLLPANKAAFAFFSSLSFLPFFLSPHSIMYFPVIECELVDLHPVYLEKRRVKGLEVQFAL